MELVKNLFRLAGLFIVMVFGSPMPVSDVAAREVVPVYSCQNLAYEKVDRSTFSFTAAASAKNGAQIASYTFYFGDGTMLTTASNTIRHDYSSPGTYVARVDVNVKVNIDGTVPTSGPHCRTTVKVEPAPIVPSYTCDAVGASWSDWTDVQFDLSWTANNGAALTSVTYDFGDGTQATFGPRSTVHHAYAQPGFYVVSVTLRFQVTTSGIITEETVHCGVTANISQLTDIREPWEPNKAP